MCGEITNVGPSDEDGRTGIIWSIHYFRTLIVFLDLVFCTRSWDMLLCTSSLIFCRSHQSRFFREILSFYTFVKLLYICVLIGLRVYSTSPKSKNRIFVIFRKRSKYYFFSHTHCSSVVLL